jgi:hydrogenase expression/formation protein HypE
VTNFSNPALIPLEDQARFELSALAARGDRLAFTTDSYVVDPLFFPGGDIGKLAVNGTVNDLAVSGAEPLYLSCGFIIEEGLAVDTLRRIAQSMRLAADTAGISIVTGDTKVVPRGMADKLFINTSGIGVIPAELDIRASRARPGDKILINGVIGDHGAAIVDARGELALENTIESDCQPLHSLIRSMLEVCPDIHCLRDATRGGLATVLNEFAQSSACSIIIDETKLPLREEVRGICEILGLDPLYLANEGKLVAVAPAQYADTVLQAMRRHPAGSAAAIIGEVAAAPAGTVIMATLFGGERIVDMLVGEQLPRIC